MAPAPARDYSARLPVELLSSTFAHLQQPDILRAAGQSRRYYRHISYGERSWWEGDAAASYVPVIARAKAFRDAVEEEIHNANPVRLSISICITFPTPGSEHHAFVDFHTWYRNGTGEDEYYERMEDMIRSLLVPSVRHGLARTCRLSIECTTSYGHLFMPAIYYHAAPILEQFRMATYEDRTEKRSLLYSVLKLPPLLFNGVAPLLSFVSLGAMDDGPILNRPVRAFARVQDVRLEGKAVDDLGSISRLFPRVRHLRLKDIGSFRVPYNPFDNTIISLQQRCGAVNLGQRLRTFRAVVSIKRAPPNQLENDRLASLLEAMGSAEVIDIDFRHESLVIVRPLLQHMCNQSLVQISLTPVANERHQLKPDPYFGPFDLRIEATVPRRSRTISMPASRALACITDLVVLLGNLTELCIPHLFLTPWCRTFCASLPLLEVFVVCVFKRRRWEESWQPDHAVFQVQDTLLTGPDFASTRVAKDGPPVDAGEYDHLETKATGWSKLQHLRVEAQVNEGDTVTVDEKTLAEFLRSFDMPADRDASRPILILSGPLELYGGGSLRSFAEDLRSAFSDVQLIDTHKRGPASVSQTTTVSPAGFSRRKSISLRSSVARTIRRLKSFSRNV